MNTIKTPSRAAATGLPHYVSLDSLRGICALAVVMYHMPSTGWLVTLPFFQNAWLFVDFFFVLSGFVIAASYGDRLAAGFPVGRFMALRLGRVYPLHVAILLVFLAFQIAILVIGRNDGGASAFSGNSTLSSFFTNLTLTQIFGFHNRVLWNSPAWSIAAEVWTYLVAAVGLSLLKHRFKWALIAAVLIMPIYMAVVDDKGLDRTYNMALERCIYGFALGMIAQGIHRTGRWLPRTRTMATLLEFLAAGVTFALICYVGPGRETLLFPLLFTVVVYVFAGDAGAVSSALSIRPFRFLGALSYSIYMMHILVIGRFLGVMGFIGGKVGIETTRMATLHGGTLKAFSGQGMIPDLQSIACLCLIVVASWFSYRYVEIPCRDWSRRVAKRIGGDSAPWSPKATAA